MKLSNTITYLLLAFIVFSCSSTTQKSEVSEQNEIDARVEELLAKMTLEEKVGQLNFYVGDLFNTGPTVRTSESDRFDELIKSGQLTGLFNVHGAAYTKRLQKLAVEESRLGIPLLFGADVIHGFKTVFPIPLASAASWDLEAIEKAERVAAEESTAAGINFNFAPMVDIARDPRWGRIAEGAGEDPYLGSRVAEARVKGFQGNKLDDPTTMAACVKHYAAYGAPFGGRDYNTVDMSERMLREVYLPPYKAAIDAGVATLMTSFNELNGIPATGNEWLLKDILREEWGFKGMVVSDWQSISEMITHGVGADSAEVGMMALKAGTDMDMMADIYLKSIPKLVKEGKLDEKYVDDAVRNVLRLKFQLGLFDDPYKYSNEEREKKEVRSAENLAIARDVARKSIVLLKNEHNLLPLDKNLKTIAVIGPLADNKADMNGTWSFFGEAQHPVSILEGIKNAVGSQSNVLFAEGCRLYDRSEELIPEAVALARKADVVILALGESAVMNGEGASRANISLPGVQQKLVEEIHKTGKPMVVLVGSGRPLAISWLDENVPAVLETWSLGSQAGLAIADVLFGDYNPSAKLPVTFPRSVGQVPIFYSHKNTGRPYEGDYSEHGSERVYKSRYRDIENTPLYPFGYGLSYSNFEYSNLKLDKSSMNVEDELKVTVDVKNNSKRAGEEVVQLYIRDLVGSVTRPVKELKDFQKVMFQPGETKTIAFTIDKNDLAYYRADMTYGVEPGEFKVFVGTNSRDVLEASFVLESAPFTKLGTSK